MTDTRIGWIGIGKIGRPMAGHLLSARGGLKVYNRTRANAEPLIADGASVVERPEDLLGAVDIVFVCVSDGAALETVLGEDALNSLGGSCPRICVEMSTVSPADSAQTAKRLARYGISYLRAPVSGSVAAAKNKQLTIIASGPKDAYDEALPLLQALSRAQFFVGEGDEARVIKIALNMMVALTATSLSESLALLRANEVPVTQFWQVLENSAVASPLLAYKKEMVLSGAYDPQFSVDQMIKDLGLALSLAHASGTALRHTKASNNQMVALSTAGAGDSDFFKITEMAFERGQA